MYSTSLPTKVGSIAYWCFVTWDGSPRLVSLEITDSWWDQEEESTVTVGKVIKNYFKGLNVIAGYKKGDEVNIDLSWQLQNTLENAKRVLIIGILKGNHAFFYGTLPWK